MEYQAIKDVKEKEEFFAKNQVPFVNTLDGHMGVEQPL
jgi:hypothetical protein